MIELVSGFPDSVVAVSAKGRVTRADYETVLVPEVERVLAHHDKLRCWYEIGPDFAAFEAGAMWEDFKVGLHHLTRWERVAVVSDVEWIRHAVNAFRILMPGEVKIFASSEADQARVWISAT